MKSRFVIPLVTLFLGAVAGFAISQFTVVPSWRAMVQKQTLKIRSLEQLQSTDRIEHLVVHQLEAFRKDTGSFPSGGNAGTMAALRSHSPQSLLFSRYPDISYDTGGNLLDPWGVPFEIKFARDSGQVFVTSAGPDHTGWTADDIRTKSD